MIRQGEGSTCPPQWLLVLLASHQSAPPTRRRLVNNVFTSTADLRTAAQEYNANPMAIRKYGPITDWDVSAITDTRKLFYNLQNFNAEISSWDTSRVTNMYQLFRVRSTAALPSAFCRTPHPLHALLAPRNHELHIRRACALLSISAVVPVPRALNA